MEFWERFKALVVRLWNYLKRFFGAAQQQPKPPPPANMVETWVEMITTGEFEIIKIRSKDEFSPDRPPPPQKTPPPFSPPLDDDEYVVVELSP